MADNSAAAVLEIRSLLDCCFCRWSAGQLAAVVDQGDLYTSTQKIPHRTKCSFSTIYVATFPVYMYVEDPATILEFFKINYFNFLKNYGL